ncbi:MAG: hypothetical protein AABX89_01455 [Candidatus Thermoplasmatota archaeon]
MPIVSVRLDLEQDKWIRKHGFKPGTFARMAVHEAIRRQEVKDASSFLGKHRITFDRSVVELIREDRDNH